MADGEGLKTSMITPNKLVSITYPRHGLHFLKENLTKDIGDISIYFQHDFIHYTGEPVGEDDLILTVIRNPIEAICSEIIAGIQINVGEKEIFNRELIYERIENQIEENIISYTKTYYTLNQYKNLMVIDFRGLQRNPKQVFQYIMKGLRTVKEYESFIMPESNDNFIASSKDHRFYEYCYAKIQSSNNIDKAFAAYSLLAKRLYAEIDFN